MGVTHRPKCAKIASPPLSTYFTHTKRDSTLSSNARGQHIGSTASHRSLFLPFFRLSYLLFVLFFSFLRPDMTIKIWRKKKDFFSGTVTEGNGAERKTHEEKEKGEEGFFFPFFCCHGIWGKGGHIHALVMATRNCVVRENVSPLQSLQVLCVPCLALRQVMSHRVLFWKEVFRLQKRSLNCNGFFPQSFHFHFFTPVIFCSCLFLTGFVLFSEGGRRKKTLQYHFIVCYSLPLERKERKLQGERKKKEPLRSSVFWAGGKKNNGRRSEKSLSPLFSSFFSVHWSWNGPFSLCFSFL